jgi:hypothetical protein
MFYTTADGQIMVADYETRAAAFVPGKPHPWSTARISVNMGRGFFELGFDGKRVLTSINPVDNTAKSASVHITLLLNFFDELKRRLP